MGYKPDFVMLFSGLKLRLKNCTTTQLASYTYALYPFMDKCVAVDWKIMVTDDVQSHHIRCHQLQAGDKLSVLLSNFKKQHAKAVILINTQDNYSIVPQFLEGEFVSDKVTNSTACGVHYRIFYEHHIVIIIHRAVVDYRAFICPALAIDS